VCLSSALLHAWDEEMELQLHMHMFLLPSHIREYAATEYVERVAQANAALQTVESGALPVGGQSNARPSAPNAHFFADLCVLELRLDLGFLRGSPAMPFLAPPKAAGRGGALSAVLELQRALAWFDERLAEINAATALVLALLRAPARDGAGAEADGAAGYQAALRRVADALAARTAAAVRTATLPHPFAGLDDARQVGSALGVALTFGDRIIVAGPLEPLGPPHALTPEVQHRFAAAATALLLGDVAATRAPAADGDRRAPRVHVAVAASGSCLGAVMGTRLLSYGLLGYAPRLARSLANAADSGFYGYHDSFHRAVEGASTPSGAAGQAAARWCDSDVASLEVLTTTLALRLVRASRAAAPDAPPTALSASDVAALQRPLHVLNTKQATTRWAVRGVGLSSLRTATFADIAM
jgi:hypothetical protein